MLLCLVVVVLWKVFYIAPLEKERAVWAAAQHTQELEKKKQFEKDRASGKLSLDQVLAEGASLPPEQMPARGEVVDHGFSEHRRIKIESPRLHGSLALEGALLDDLTLADYKVTLAKDSPDVVLLAPKGTKEAYFIETGWLPAGEGVRAPDKTTLWKTDHDKLTPENPVTLTWDNGAGLHFKRHIALDKNYLFTITDTVENAGKVPAALHPYGLINRTRVDAKAYYVSQEGPLGAFNGVLTEAGYGTLKKESKDNPDAKMEHDSDNGWMGIADQYWLTALIPAQDAAFHSTIYYYNKSGQDRYQVDFRSQHGLEIPAGGSASFTQHVFAGAKMVKIIDTYRTELNLPLFDRTINYGSLYFLTRPMFFVLDFFNGLLGNFGLAILLMTVLVKLCVFPLANKSFRSMARLKTHMPELQALRERFKHDKPKMNQEMMKFYKENRINPMAGCMPLLVQIPVFFSLYKVLFITIEMRHAPFFGWIKDLSASDPLNIINLFGVLPWGVPHWFPAIGPFSVLFVLTMYLQQWISPQPTDQTQRTIARVMPLFLVVMFSNSSFPVGLVIYWCWSNSLSILQQWVITRKLNKR